MAEISEEAARRFAPFQTDHLIVLVGTNPLPNYVAARLLIRQGNTDHKVWLVHSAATEPVARRLHAHLKYAGIQTETRSVHESNPNNIREVIGRIAASAKGRVGLHYTGGTKAMAVHAYLALKQWADGTFAKPVYSYLDARHVQMVIDAGNPDGTDACIAVDLALSMTVTEIAELHGRQLESLPHTSPVLPAASQALLQSHLQNEGWSEWVNQMLRELDEKTGRRNLKKPVNLKGIEMPADRFVGVRDAFHQMAVPPMAGTLGEWAKATQVFSDNNKSIDKFAKWLEGGWLEDVVLQALLDMQAECRLTAPSLGYNIKSLTNPGQSNFEFDVAATRGHQLFAISCTTSASKDLCKSKLFEAYRRARQLGGDAARIALVSFYPDASALAKSFADDEEEAEKSVLVLGAREFSDLAFHLKHWVQTARD